MIKSQLQISRRWFIRGSLASLLLSSCGENKLGRTIIDAYKLTFQDRPSPPFTREYITKLPYASISAKIGKGPKSLLVLWRVENNEQFWLAADGVVLGMKKGRILKTAGLPETIIDTIPINNDPIYLMGQNFFGINESIRLRGWNSWRLGDKLLYGTIEPRIGTQQLVLASFIDFGNAWDNNNHINDILYTMGFEIRLNLGLVILSYGAAQDFNRWKNNSVPFNYLQLALVNPF